MKHLILVKYINIFTLVISMGTRISLYPNPEYLPESDISYPNLSLFLLISRTLADQVQTYLDFINSFKNETIQLKCTIILFSHPCKPFIVFYLSFILVVYTLSNHRNPLKIVSISKQLLNSESIKRCILAI